MPHEESEFVLIIKSYATFEKFVKLIRGDDEAELARLTNELKESAQPLKEAIEQNS
jgi:hypothetical protein